MLQIDPKHHPNIIGRKGATINKIRDDFGVRIQLPEKDHIHSDEITIIGYEHQVHLAKDAILKIVRALVSVTSFDILSLELYSPLHDISEIILVYILHIFSA